MTTTIEPPVGPPLGFPKCQQCTYLRNGPPGLCLACAGRSFEVIASHACPVCSQIMENGECPNWLCTDPDRRIARVRAIAYSSGQLRTTIHRYKYKGKAGWSLVFGRLLVAWLDRNARHEVPDLIIANPTYVGEGGASFGHTERVLDVAATEDVLGEWSFDVADPRALVKVEATPKSAAKGAQGKRTAATELRSTLHLAKPELIEGRRILVYDDVSTTCSQLNTVAGFLLDEGHAEQVEGIVLARAPWRARGRSRQ